MILILLLFSLVNQILSLNYLSSQNQATNLIINDDYHPKLSTSSELNTLKGFQLHYQADNYNMNDCQFTSRSQVCVQNYLIANDLNSPQGLVYRPFQSKLIPNKPLTRNLWLDKKRLFLYPTHSWNNNQNNNHNHNNRVTNNNQRIFPFFRIFKCKKEGFFRDPDNCNVFHRCVVYAGISTIYKFTFRCGPGLVFDKRYQVCNYPDSVYPRCIVGLDEDD